MFGNFGEEGIEKRLCLAIFLHCRIGARLRSRKIHHPAGIRQNDSPPLGPDVIQKRLEVPGNYHRKSYIAVKRLFI
jgi:hypothetical protein